MSAESWWQRQYRLYGYDQSKWWAAMPIAERIDMVDAVIGGGSIPVWTPAGANTLYLRGAPIGEVVDCILALVEDQKIPSVIDWLDDLTQQPGDARIVRELGIRGWFLQRGYI